MISFGLVNKPELKQANLQITPVMLFYVKNVTIGGLFKMMMRARLMEKSVLQGILEFR